MADMFRDSDEEGEEEEVLLFLLLMRRRRRRLRQTWSRLWKMRRETPGTYANLIRELNAEDPERFRQCHRLTRESFNEIFTMVFH